MTKKKVWQIAGICCLCVCVLMGCVLGVVFGMNHTSEPVNLATTNENVVVSIEQSSYHDVFLSATVNADGSQTITATVEKKHDVDGTLEWTLAFSDESSDWAIGKNVADYVSMTISEDTQSATLQCIEAFGEQIIVSAKAKYYYSVTATATVDYVKRVSNVSVVGLNSSYSGSTSYENLIRIGEDSSTAPVNYLTLNVEYGIGTINGEVNFDSVSLDLGSYYNSAVSTSGYIAGASTFNQETNFSLIDKISSICSFKAPVKGGFIYGGGDLSVWSKLVNWFAQQATGNGIQASMSCSVSLFYNGSVIETKDFALGGYFLIADTIEPADISLEGQDVAF